MVLVEEEKTNHIHIYSVNDFHGSIESLLWSEGRGQDLLDNSGIRLLSFLAREKKEKENVLVLSIGDMFQKQDGNGWEFEGLTFELMRDIGFHAMSIGNHEFDWHANSEEYFTRLSSAINSPLISCNLYNKNNMETPKGLVRSKIIRSCHMKIGLIGAVTPQCQSLCTREELGEFMVKEGEEDIKKEILKLKSQGADFIILLGHMDIYYNDSNILEGELVDLVNKSNFQDIDLILSGHSHQLINDFIGGIPLVQAGANGDKLAYIKISTKISQDNKRIEAIEIMDPLALADENLDQGIIDLSQEYIRKNHRKKQLIGPIPPIIKKSKEVNLAWIEYVLESIRQYSEADVVTINYKFFRKPILGNRVFDKDILDLIPFKNYLFSMKLKGSLLIKVFEEYENKALRGGYFTGLRAKDIERDKEYSLVTTDFMAGGGDNFTLLKEGKDRKQYNISIQDIVLSRLREENKRN